MKKKIKEMDGNENRIVTVLRWFFSTVLPLDISDTFRMKLELITVINI